MKTIVELSKKYNTDKKMNDGTKAKNGWYGHNYAELYDMVISGMDIKTMLEIGIGNGSSIRMWDEYFDHETFIYAIDINKKSTIQFLGDENIYALIGNQNDKDFLDKYLSYETFDFIVDDGSHRMKDQQLSLKYLFPKLRSGGLYVIEDLHTSKDRKFHDSKPETTTLELLHEISDLVPQVSDIKNVPHSNYISETELKSIIKEIREMEVVDDKICFMIKN